MVVYTGFGAGAPTIAYPNDTNVYTLGTAFKVTESGYQLTKGRIWLSSNGGAVAAADVTASGTKPLKFSLMPANATGVGATGPVLFAAVSLATVVMDAWNEFVVPSPYDLTVDTIYYASVYVPSGRYSYTAGKFVAQVAGGGPIVFPADGAAQGSTGTVLNGSYNSTPGDPGLTPPNQHFNASWFGVDVEVSTGAVPGEVSGTGTATLGALTGTATGVRATTGSASVTLGALAGTATGVRGTASVGAASLGALTGTAAGTRGVAGSAAAALGSLAAAGVGTVTSPRTETGTATSVLGALTAAMVGARTVVGSAASALGALAAAAVGDRTPGIPAESRYRSVNDLVAQAWLASLPGFSPDMVGATLPQDTSGWAETGFVQATVVSGSPDQYTHLRTVHVQLDCWAVTPNSSKPPWLRAGQVAEAILAGTVNGTGQQTKVGLGTYYSPARILTVRALGEPRRVPSDEGAYARLNFDVQITWVRTTTGEA